MDTEYHIHKQRLATLRQETQRWPLSKLAQSQHTTGKPRITRIRRLVVQIVHALPLTQLVVIAIVIALAALAGYGASAQPELMRFEVAEDGSRFVFGQDHLFPDGNPNYGTPFVTQGYLYPEGTLNGSNGVLPDGSPEFPDAVIGEWTCYGYMIGEGARTTTGIWVISTQVYKFNDSDDIIVTNGFELVDLNMSATRAVIGGTGAFSSARGEQRQELFGFTAQMGVNLRVEFEIEQ